MWYDFLLETKVDRYFSMANLFCFISIDSCYSENSVSFDNGLTLRWKQNVHHFADDILTFVLVLISLFKFHRSYTQWFSKQKCSIATDNGSVPNRRHIIFWINCDLVDCIIWSWWFNTLRPRRGGRHFAADIFKCIFLNKNIRISIEISLKFVPEGS